MAVALVTSPDPLALTRGGRMRYRFTGSGRVVTTGSYAVNAVNFPGSLPVTDGTRFSFRWDGKTVDIIAKTSPSEPNHIPTGHGTGAYVASLLDYFSEYYPFREDFIVSLDSMGGSNSLIFEATKPGARYNFTAIDSKPNVANIDPRFKATDALVRERYSIYVELYLQKPGTPGTNRKTDFERVYQTPIEADADGVAEFDAGDILHPLLRADLPAWNARAASPATDSHRRYFVSYAEAWGSPLQVGRVKDDAILDAYLGGADYLHRAGAGFDLLATVKRISAPVDLALRLGSLTRFTRTDEPQFLTFINTRTHVQAGLRIRLTFDNGTGLTLADRLPPFTFGVGQKWIVPTGVSQLDLLGYVPAGRSLVEYTLRLTTAGSDPDGNLHLSAEYRYVLMGGYEPYARYFGYLSSLGAIETLTTFGKGSHELTRFYEQAERALGSQYSAPDGQFIDYDVALQQQVEVATGFRPKAELSGWNDFYRSPVRFRLRALGTAWEVLPIGLLSKSIKTAKDGDTLFAHRFEYAYLFRDDFYSAPEDSPELIGDGTPPAALQPPAGVVIINQPVVVNSVDPTVPDVVRTLTPGDIAGFRTAAARPNPETLGFLSQQAADNLYYRKSQKIDYVNDVVNKPSEMAALLAARLQAMQQVFSTVQVRTRLKSWTGDTEPETTS